MSTLSDYFKGTFLKAADLNGKTVKVTITEVGEFESNEGRLQPTLGFKETDLVLGINKTNGFTIADLIGTPNLPDWIGHRIELFPTKTDFGGKRVDCIRVKEDFHEAPAPLASSGKSIVRRRVVPEVQGELESDPLGDTPPF